MIARASVAALLIAAAPGVQAQALRCAVPARVERPRPDLPSDREPSRVLPIGSYTLAVTWAPQYCHEHARQPSARFQCGAGNRFGFTLHGLWPDGVGREWPQYCRAASLLPPAVVRANICSTPSAQLLQHEWAKHGTCMPGLAPAAYFERSTGLYARLRFPDMNRLSRGTLTVGALAQAIAAANRGMTADMVRVTANRQGWLDELWFCLNKRFAPTRCPAHAGGQPTSATIRIWRGAR
jgi:ribonuclease T2